MKVFFDTNVYVSEAILGQASEKMIVATERAAWRIYASAYLLDELVRVLTEKLGFSRRFAQLSRQRVIRRAKLCEPGTSRHQVPGDIKDSPVLRAALAAGAHYLVTNDPHLLTLNPCEGLEIISLTDYYKLLVSQGLIT
jgi:putative PIN family toxin of toxin-antitoxin system